jgi:putative transposase
MRSGRPRTVEDEAVAELITETLSRKPKAATHRSVRGIPKKPGFQEHRPSPVSALRAATSPHPQLQAFPPIPSSSRSCEGITHDYQRHGTTTLFAALNVLDGAVIAQCKPRHRHQEFLAFLRHIEANAPAQRDVHLVVDNSPPTSIPRSKFGSHAVRVGTFTSRPPMPLGSIRSNVSSPSSLNALSVAALSVPPPTSSKKNDRFIRTHNANSQPFDGPAQPMLSSKNSRLLIQAISGVAEEVCAFYSPDCCGGFVLA